MNGRKKLLELYRATLHPRFADMKVSYSDATANGLTQMVLQFINLSGYQAERISTSGRYIDNKKIVTNVLGQRSQIGSGKYIPGTGTKGSADISSTIKGMSIKWEVKIGRDKQSEAQIKYQAQIEKAGGKYFLIHSFEEFYEFYLQLIK